MSATLTLLWRKPSKPEVRVPFLSNPPGRQASPRPSIKAVILSPDSTKSVTHYEHTRLRYKFFLFFLPPSRAHQPVSFHQGAPQQTDAVVLQRPRRRKQVLIHPRPGTHEQCAANLFNNSFAGIYLRPKLETMLICNQLGRSREFNIVYSMSSESSHHN